MVENIPAELKTKKQWVVWLKGNKTPVNARTLTNAQSNNPQTWSTYDEAYATVKHGGADGVGFVFNNDYIAIDLDDCFEENKQVKKWASEIMNTVYPTYMEKSISGKGVHIILPRTVSLPGKGLNVNFQKYGINDGIGGFEMYENGRFFILTGDILNAQTKDIKDNTEKAIPFYVKYKLILEKNKNKGTDVHANTNIFDEVSSRIKLETVLSQYGVRVGRDNKTCCPFHNEKTPSFHVYENDYYCFGCQEYGDAVDFVMKMEGLNNGYEAVKKINEMYSLGIKFEDKTIKTKEPINLNIDTSQALPEHIELLLGKAYDLSNVPEYDPDKAETVKSGIPQLDRYIGAFEMGKTTVWTGINGAGKSTVLGQAMVESIEQNYNVFAFSGELQAHKFQYWIDLQTAGKPYLTRHISKITGQEYCKIDKQAEKKIHEWYKDKFFLYDNKQGMKYENILEVMDAFNQYKKCRVFLIDNVMRLDVRSLDRDMYEAQSQFINSIADFAQNRNVHVHIVAHPRKIIGSIITKMDISGSGDLTNRADNVLAVHRVTPAYQEEMRKNLKGNLEILQSVLNASNVVEVFKCRETGNQDLFIPLRYCADSKRLIDISNPKLENKHYSWDKDGWLKDAIDQTELDI